MDTTREKFAVDDAESVAVRAITFLTEDEDRIRRFLDLTGLTPSGLEVAAARRDFLRAVLEHLLADESLLMTFAANAALNPATVRQAHRILDSGGSEGC